MANYICKKCNNKDSIKWSVTGDGLVKMIIDFKCSKCGAPGFLKVEFPDDGTGDARVDISVSEVDYVG